MNMDRITVGDFAHILIRECGEKPVAEEKPFAEEKTDAKRGIQPMVMSPVTCLTDAELQRSLIYSYETCLELKIWII